MCHAKYNAGWGVIIEMRFQNEEGLRYFSSEAPDDHIKDALSMKHEHDLGHLVTTPEELYTRMRAVAPTVNSIIHCVDEEKGHYRLPDALDLAAIPEWSWYEFLLGVHCPRSLLARRTRIARSELLLSISCTMLCGMCDTLSQTYQ
jgi:hypothetical protein